MTIQPNTVILVIGVSGSGKSTIAAELSKRLHLAFLEGDDFHSPAEIAKMKAGHPLTDEDRWPWLARIRDGLEKQIAAGTGAVVACSGLRKAYRQYLIGNIPGARLIYLKGAEPLIAARMHRRKGHFMPASLLDSQFATLEEPGAEEHPITVSVDGSEEKTLKEIESKLSISP
jgi:carbohydrate kinase (thermoresistant glucokinase family)